MLLKLYITTTAISWAATFIFSAACWNKIKRDGYKYVKGTKSFLEKGVNFISAVFKCSIPVYNIVNTIVLFCMGDKIYDYVEEQLLKEGKIYKPIIVESKNDVEKQNLNNEEETSYIKSTKKTKTEKPYDEMTVEEKLAYLQQERDRVINESVSQVEKPITLNRERI